MSNRWEIHWKDYYKILQVHPTAEQEVIKAAYDRLARKYHPDVSQEPFAPQRMAEINEAYEVLGNLNTRRQYHPVWIQKRRESNNNEAPPRASTRSGTYKRPETPIRPTSSKRSIPAWLKWGISLLVVGVILTVVVPNLTSPSQIPNPEIPLPTTPINSLPRVTIQSVTLPPNPIVSSGDLIFTHTFRVVNNESFDVTINWKGNSSITGNFDNGTVTVPKNSYTDVPKSYYYITTGIETITYTVYYNGIQLDEWSGTHYINPSLRPVPVRLPTGTYLVKKLISGDGELIIDNGPDLDAVAILSSLKEPKIPLMAVYIRAGASHTIRGISDGVYNLYFSLGEDWDEDSKRFMEKAKYQRFEDGIDFITSSIQYTIWEVTLHPVVGGEADTDYLDEDEFPSLD